MPRDWPDPRFPDKPISPIAIALGGLLVAFGYVAMILGAIEMARTVMG
jgi:hypothetical protein